MSSFLAIDDGGGNTLVVDAYGADEGPDFESEAEAVVESFTFVP